MIKGDIKIAVIGLGYVGLPLAIEFSKKYRVVGYDIDVKRIEELKSNVDSNKDFDDFLSNIQLKITSNSTDIEACNVFIIAVPTPIDTFKKPDLSFVLSASKAVAQVLKLGDTVIYESTVYPGCTEEDCVPVLEQYSKLTFNKDFWVGYSPERISPGDKIHTLPNVVKITSGSNPQAATFVDNLYKSIISAGTYKAANIKVAEAAKLVENCQRDVNISFVNELVFIFDKMKINTKEVLEAAGTKWNFINFSPGLVGGHCIGVDPYYMIHKAESLGYYPNLIGAGRRINDRMGHYVAEKVIKLLIEKELNIKKTRALILGITFKEDCADIRNTRVVDIYQALIDFGLQVAVHDPWADVAEVKEKYDIELIETLENEYDAIIVAVAHSIFLEQAYLTIAQKAKVVFDIKGILPKSIGAMTL